MEKSRVTPYEGNENYIFISYAHKRSEESLNIIRALDEAGFRVWYDDGIAPGSEWPEYIADHMNRAAVVVAFISPEAIASANCRREVTYALSKEKPFLGVILEKTEMSPGMELQLSAHQCILRYEYPDEEVFLKSLTGTEMLQSCLRPPAVSGADKNAGIKAGSADPAPAEETGHSGSESPDLPDKEEPVNTPEEKKQGSGTQNRSGSGITPPRITEEDMKTVGEMVSYSSGKTGKTSGRKKLVRVLGIIAGSVLVLILLLILLPFLNDAVNTVKLTDTITVSKDASAVNLENETISQEMISKIGRLKNLETLKFTACDFENAGHLAKLDNTQLSELEINRCSGITEEDYAFLSDAAELKKLIIIGCGVKDGNIPFERLEALEELDLSANPDLTDVSELKTDKLISVRLDGTGVEDLSMLADAKELKILTISGTPVEKADFLLKLEKLTDLNISGTKIRSINGKLKALRLVKLCAADVPLDSCEAFDNLTILEELDLSGTGISEASCIRKSSGSLRKLNLSGCDPSEELLKAVADCADVREIDLSGIPLEDLQLLKKMSRLERVRAEDCGLTSLIGIETKKNLTGIYAARNKIQRVSTLPETETSIMADLRYNEITTLYGLPDNRYIFLALHGNRDLDPMKMLSSEKLTINYVSLDWQDNLERAETFLKKAGGYYICGCPDDRVVAMENRMGSKLVLTDEEKLDRAIESEGMDPYKWPEDILD